MLSHMHPQKRHKKVIQILLYKRLSELSLLSVSSVVWNVCFLKKGQNCWHSWAHNFYVGLLCLQRAAKIEW